MKYLKLALIVADVAVNVVLLGSCDETLSSRAWRMEQEGKPWGRLFRPLIDALFFWQPQHCFCQYARERLAGGVWASLNQPSA
jgi:hypothetical protein